MSRSRRSAPDHARDRALDRTEPRMGSTPGRPAGSRPAASRAAPRRREEAVAATTAAIDNPVAMGGALVMALTACLIVANAAFFQSDRHPAPLVDTRARPEAIAPAPAPAPDPVVQAQRKLVLDVQVELRRLGFYEGSLDGLSGPATVRAVRAWERARGLPETGEIDERLLARLALDTTAAAGAAGDGVPLPPTAPASALPAGAGAATGEAPRGGERVADDARPVATPAQRPGSISDLIARTGDAPVPPASIPAAPERERIRRLQQSLADLGYGPIDIDGVAGEQTANAIRRFELDRGLDITGRIGPMIEQEIDKALRR